MGINLDLEEKFRADLDRKGFGIGPNNCQYKLILWGPKDIPSFERVTPSGNREIIVGSRGETFSSMEQVKTFVYWDSKEMKY